MNRITRSTILATALVLLPAAAALAGEPAYDPATDPALNKQLEAVRGAVYARKSIVLEGMLELTPEQQTAFNPVLKAYDDEVLALGDRRLALIKEYAGYYNDRSLDDKNAKRLVLATIKIKQDQLALYKKYFDKASKVIGVKKAAEFIQVENAFAGAVDLKLALEMPRVGSAMKE